MSNNIHIQKEARVEEKGTAAFESYTINLGNKSLENLSLNDLRSIRRLIDKVEEQLKGGIL